MVLLLTAAVVLITIFTGGLVWLAFGIPLIIIVFIQNPSWFAAFLICIPIAIAYFVVANKAIDFGNKIYNETVFTPRKERELQESQQKELDRFNDYIRQGRFNGTNEKRLEIIDYIKNKHGVPGYESWDYVYYIFDENNNFIHDWEFNVSDTQFKKELREKINANIERAVKTFK